MSFYDAQDSSNLGYDNFFQESPIDPQEGNCIIKKESDFDSLSCPESVKNSSEGKWRRSLIGVVISCGPGNHLATFEGEKYKYQSQR